MGLHRAQALPGSAYGGAACPVRVLPPAGHRAPTWKIQAGCWAPPAVSSTPEAQRVLLQQPAVIVRQDCNAQLQQRYRSGTPPVSVSQRTPSTPSAAPKNALATKEGDLLEVGGVLYRAGKKLGAGSFGVVWEATIEAASPDVAPIAVKCAMPATVEAFKAAVREADVLRQLSEALPEDGDAARRAPRYLSHSVTAARPGFRGTVNVAMTKVVGVPVDKWLYGCDENALKKIDMTELLHGRLPGGQMATRSLDKACAAVSALLSQTAPVFAALAGFAYHRDISAHNLLIHDAGNDNLDFAVIDFGLAVPSQSFAKEWGSTDISGDPRYWSPAAWMLFAHGHKYLENHPDQTFRRQYTERIDHFPMGILAAELFFALCEAPAETLPRMASARSAWHTYWTRANGLFRKVHAVGCLKMREHLLGSRVASELAEELKSLCVVLRAAAEDALESSSVQVWQVLTAISDLLDGQGSLEWEQLSSFFADVPAASRMASVVAPVARPRLPSHRRVWSVDEAVSLRRGVPALGRNLLGQTPELEGTPEAEA